MGTVLVGVPPRTRRVYDSLLLQVILENDRGIMPRGLMPRGFAPSLGIHWAVQFQNPNAPCCARYTALRTDNPLSFSSITCKSNAS